MSDLPVPVDPAPIVPLPTPDGVIGWIVGKGISWVVKKTVDGILKKFRDDDRDGEPDDPDDEGETVNLPSDVSYIMVNPDGTMVIYDSNGNITQDNCDMAYSLWVSENGIMHKKLNNYTVSEGLLALILLFTVINFVRGLFRRGDFFK